MSKIAYIANESAISIYQYQYKLIKRLWLYLKYEIRSVREYSAIAMIVQCIAIYSAMELAYKNFCNYQYKNNSVFVLSIILIK